ncbi:hypothetical protein CC86DRAFT_41279 [Ophiobolus disseminans]|uniref:Uncharacterized protein n=1 Tax=Ophiobolus disseminans TaxID=1469910 RepID=A0A6A6ZWS3_9PLEO|nr:hypothetical protein CC86DRAFT_41279 [Ophiobolus disseminans]
MGICSSCLGARRTSESDQSDTSHLLHDPYQPNYGTANGSHNTPQPDPEELRRQRETLERICAETSEQLIPVSQATAIPPEVAEQLAANDTEYARMFNERFATIRKQPSRPSSAEAADAEEDETAWLEQALGGQGEDEVDQIEPTKGGLTIQFGAR